MGTVTLPSFASFRWRVFAVALLYALAFCVHLAVLPFEIRKAICTRSGSQDQPLQSFCAPEASKGDVGTATLSGYGTYGLIMASYSIVKVVSSPIIGYLSDEGWGGPLLGLRFTLLCSCATMLLSATASVGDPADLWGVASIGARLSPSWWHGTYGLLFCRLLMGCFASNGSMVSSYIVRSTDPARVLADPADEACAHLRAELHSQRTVMLSTVYSSWDIAHMVTPLILQSIRQDWATASQASALLFIAAWGMTWTLPQSQPRKADKIATANGSSSKPSKGKGAWRTFVLAFSDPVLLQLLLVGVLAPASIDYVPVMRRRYGAEFSAAHLAFRKTVRSVSGILMSMSPVVTLLSRFSNQTLAVGGYLVKAALLLMVPFCASSTQDHVIDALQGAVASITVPSEQALMSSLAKDYGEGMLFGASHSLKGLQLSAGTMSSSLMSSFSVALPFYVAAIGVVVKSHILWRIPQSDADARVGHARELLSTDLAEQTMEAKTAGETGAAQAEAQSVDGVRRRRRGNS